MSVAFKWTQISIKCSNFTTGNMYALHMDMWMNCVHAIKCVYFFMCVQPTGFICMCDSCSDWPNTIYFLLVSKYNKNTRKRSINVFEHTEQFEYYLKECVYACTNVHWIFKKGLKIDKRARCIHLVNNHLSYMLHCCHQAYLSY